MRVTALEHAAVYSVASRMRAADQAEIFALRFPGDDTPERLAVEVMALAGLGGVILEPDGTPAAVLGFVPRWPGVFDAFLFATDAWPSVWRDAMRFGRRILQPAIMAQGAWRAQCHSKADHHDAHRFLRHLGFEAEGPAVPYGRNREPFIPFAQVLA